MLIVQDTEAVPDGQLNLDNLVVNVEWPTTSAQPPRYWRTGDFHNSLLEIGLHPYTGRLVSVTLVIIKELGVWLPGQRNLDEITDTVVNGVPVFDLTNWQNDNQFVDERNDLQVKLGTDRLSIEWGDEPAPVRCVQSERILFGVDVRDALYAVQIMRLSNEEVASIRNIYAR